MFCKCTRLRKSLGLFLNVSICFILFLFSSQVFFFFRITILSYNNFYFLHLFLIVPPLFPPPLSGRSYIEQISLFRNERRAIGCPSYLWFLAFLSVQVDQIYLSLFSCYKNWRFNLVINLAFFSQFICRYRAFSCGWPVFDECVWIIILGLIV